MKSLYLTLALMLVTTNLLAETIKKDYYSDDDYVVYDEDGRQKGVIKKDYYNDRDRIYKEDDKEFRIRRDYYSRDRDQYHTD